ncbi:MAG TPA: tetratricopeptide repeat protein [Terriglobales bacterium]|nr:tetratricopeptide repeat protein [Terriglobales bacterium]
MSSPSPSIGQVLGHYRIEEQIGAGGMGIVYRAHDLQLDRDVAVKVLPAGTISDSGARLRFHKEALALARLNHPNIATVHEFGGQNGVDFLVIEYIPGVTLNTKLLSGPLPESEAITLAVQLAQALEAAHEQGVVHRDLKPGNLRLSSKGQLKVLDFGLAKLARPLDASLATETLGQNPILSGTLPYMSPEQVRGHNVDERSDIWAAGAVMYEMTTGQRPFPERHPPRLIDDILRQPPKPPTAVNPRLSPGLEAIILKALDKDPERRYQTARELRVDLNRLLPSGSGAAPVSTGVRFVRPGRKHRKALLVALAVLLLVALALVGWRLKHRIQPVAQLSPRILAVLPFQAVAGDSATNALGTGMTETLTTKLAQLSDRNSLQLVSTHEIQAQNIKTAEQAHRDFGVDWVLEGSLQQAGSLLRINCNLVDAATRITLGSRSFTAPANDIFGLEDKVVEEALDILAVDVPRERRASLQTHPDTKPEAYQHYLRGIGYLQEYQKQENIQSAIAEFGQALQVDPNYGRAYAGMGEAYWMGFQQSNRTNDWIALAEENCKKALALTSDIAEGHSCLGDVYNGQGRYQTAADEFQKALSQDNTQVNALRGLADAYEKLGKLPAAEAAYRQAIALRPQYWAGYDWLGAFDFHQARYGEAVQMFQRVIKLAPENFQGYSNLGAALTIQGKYTESIQALKRSIELRPTLEAYSNLGAALFALRRFSEAAETFQQGLKLDDREPIAWGNLGDALYWAPGRREEAAAAYRKAISLSDAKLQINAQDATVMAFRATYHAMVGDKAEALSDARHALQLAPGDAEVNFRAALVYTHLGDTQQCVLFLEKAVGAGYPASAIRDTPDFDALRNNPRIEKLLAKQSAREPKA